jgi:hypothetical protein
MTSESEEWFEYLKETDKLDRYDGCCNCSFCASVRKEYDSWENKRKSSEN